MMQLQTILLGIVVAPVLLFSGTYYVSPSGNDGQAGTFDQPFASLQKAHDTVVAGDTVILRGGMYMPKQQTVFKKRGNASAWFILKSYEGEWPIIDGQDIPEGNIQHSSTPTWSFQDAAYWKIEGPITLINGRGAGLDISDSHDIQFIRIRSSYNGKTASRGAHGFFVWYSDNLLFENCDADHNANHLWKDGEDQASNQYQHGDGWRIFGGANIRLIGCRSWHNLDDNYDFYGESDPVKMIECWSAYAGIDDAEGSITGIPNNAMPRIDPSDLLWGNGIKLGYNKDAVSHHVERCLSWNNNAAGMHMNKGPSVVYNTASFGNKAFGFDYTDGNLHTMHNNWDWMNNYDNPGYPETFPDLNQSSHNSWDSTLSVLIDETDFMSISDSGMFGPRREDGSLPDSPFLRLVAGSDMIDAGLDVGIDFLGTAPDLGAFEYKGDTTALPWEPKAAIAEFGLHGYPNPFNSSVVISYRLAHWDKVKITIFDIRGRYVTTLLDVAQPAGEYKVRWEALDSRNRQVASGMYVALVQTASFSQSVKMIYIR